MAEMAFNVTIETRSVRAGNVEIGGGRGLVLIGGPCVIESEESAFRHAEAIQKIASDVGIPYIYKSSFDKANRSSGSTFRGPGLKKGLAILAKVKKIYNLPILSDIHTEEQAEEAASVLDILQIPAFLCRQTDLILTAARTGKVVNVKKGQFLAPWDMKNIVEKIESVGNRNILLTERGASFGYNNLVSDFRSIPIMQSFGYPVVFDATHSVQIPGGKGTSSGGQREFIPLLSKCGVAAGADAIFMEIHENPEEAKSDGPNAEPLSELRSLLVQLMRLKEALTE